MQQSVHVLRSWRIFAGTHLSIDLRDSSVPPLKNPTCLTNNTLLCKKHIDLADHDSASLEMMRNIFFTELAGITTKHMEHRAPSKSIWEKKPNSVQMDEQQQKSPPHLFCNVFVLCAK